MQDILQNVHSFPSTLCNFTSNRELARHRWFEFKEGYSSELVSLACSELRGKRRIRLLDPFMGSGTALVTAGYLGHTAVGVEVNPFLHFASKAKCTKQLVNKSSGLTTLSNLFASRPVEMTSSLEGQSTFTERPGADKWIFNRSVLRGFTALWNSIDGRSAVGGPLRLALLASLMDCSNVRRDGKCVRYAKDWKLRGTSSADLRARFKLRALQAIDDLTTQSFTAQNLSHLRGDCRQQLAKLESGSFDLFVTSPPYLNSFDYSDVYRPELFAGGFVGNNDELRKIRVRTIRSHVQVKREYSDTIESKLLVPILDALPSSLWSKDIPGMIRSYFSDMLAVLKQLHRVTKPGGEGWLVVSTSAYAGVEIPVDLILADLAAKASWNLRGVYVLRQLRAAGQHWAHLEPGAKPPLRESLIIVKRGK